MKNTIRAALMVALFLPVLVWAQLTNGQMQTLRTVCAADSSCNASMLAADDIALAAWFNTVDATYIVWRSDIRVSECDAAMVWTEIDALTVGKARIWEWMRSLGVLDARQTNIRQGLSDAFSGATATRTALLVLAKRGATRAEKALATGSGTSGSPSLMTFVGPVSYADASLIRSM